MVQWLRPSETTWRWANWGSPKASDLRRSQSIVQKVAQRVECSLPRTGLSPQWCPVNRGSELSGITWKVTVKIAALVTRCLLIKSQNSMEKFPSWKSPGRFSHRESSGEDYVGLGFTLWYKRCLTMRWLGWLGGWWWQVGNQTENKTDLWLENRTQTTVEKQGALDCQGPQGNWYLRKLGQLLHMSKFSDYIIIL